MISGWRPDVPLGDGRTGLMGAKWVTNGGPDMPGCELELAKTH